MEGLEYKASTVRSTKPFSESLTEIRPSEEHSSNGRVERQPQVTSSGFGQQSSATPPNGGSSQAHKRNMDNIAVPSSFNKKLRRATSSQPDESEPPPSANGERPRLTEQEKKNNHIASEQKRRQAIREGFDRLTELVPGLEGQGRSESVVLRKSVDFMRKEVEERRTLVARIEALGGEIPENLK
jgi:heteromeric Ino2p/Ino4p transcription factor